MTAAPLLSAAGRFLITLFASKPKELQILLWTLPEKRSYWSTSVDDAIRLAESMRGHDLYVGFGLASQNYGPDKRCVSDQVAGIVGVYADLDLRSAGHPKPTLPESAAQALSILPPEFVPTFLIRTGYGLQAWWLFPQLWVFRDENERRTAAKLLYRWHTMLRDKASQHGWKYDRLADLARVLRVPGTSNCKFPENPQAVVIQSHSDFRYSPAELAEYLDALGVADQDAEFRTKGNSSEPCPENQLKIDLSARIGEQRIKAWTESDKRFEATWFRHRHDLKDQSQSGYDMALADFGVKAALADQEIVDLIVSHRAVHRQQPRTRVDYFERTIAKAREIRMSTPNPSSKRSGSETAELLDPTQLPTNAEQSAQKKIDLSKSISAALGIEVLRMVKVSGDNPLYRMDLAEGSISFPSIEKLMSQRAVRGAIAAKVGILIPEFRPPLWKNLVQMMLDACIHEDGGEELECRGAACLCLREYLAETAFINCIGGQQPQDLRKPMVRNGQIAVCASDLQLYLNRTRSYTTSIAAVVALLSAAGAKVERVRGKFREQSRWMLPLDEFDSDDYASSMAGGLS